MPQELCGICGRLMNVESDDLSTDCGGHCWGCVGEIEANKGFEPSMAVVLDEWRRGLRPNWRPSSLTLNPTFAELRETPLHLVMGAQWEPYYAQMSPYLRNARRDIREMAIERLMMAVFRSEARHRKTEDRVVWLLGEIEAVHRQYTDVLSEFLRGLRWHGDDDDFPSILLPWLDKLEAQPPAGVDPGLIRGARILIAPRRQDDAQQMADWIAHLDDTSNWVRGCAARNLATVVDDDDDKQLVELIAAREIARPGVAGPFAGEFLLRVGVRALARRITHGGLDDGFSGTPAGPGARDDMPFNDIEFYLHELCSTSPAHDAAHARWRLHPPRLYDGDRGTRRRRWGEADP